MEKVSVDISLFTGDSAFGRLSGAMEVDHVPTAGEVHSFLSSIGEPPESGIGSFDGTLTVETVLHSSDMPLDCPLVLFSDIVVDTQRDARLVVEFFEKLYGLDFEQY